jgi:hypothetical protein
LGEELIEKQRHWVITWVYNALSKMAWTKNDLFRSIDQQDLVWFITK